MKLKALVAICVLVTVAPLAIADTAAVKFTPLVKDSTAQFGDLREKFNDARLSLVEMLLNDNKHGEDQQKLVHDSADAVSKSLAHKGAKFREREIVWAAFKKTRETELVPLILAGKIEEANKIGGGIQQARYSLIAELMNDLERH